MKFQHFSFVYSSELYILWKNDTIHLTTTEYKYEDTVVNDVFLIDRNLITNDGNNSKY